MRFNVLCILALKLISLRESLRLTRRGFKLNEISARCELIYDLFSNLRQLSLLLNTHTFSNADLLLIPLLSSTVVQFQACFFSTF